MDRPFAAYTGDDPYIFVCYAHDDASTVYPEISWLKNQGHNIWYDEGITPGETWTQELADAIQGASFFIYFASPTSVASRYCQNEIQYATTQEKTILAIHLVPTQLTGGLELSIGATQAIMKHELNRADYEAKLLSSLKLEKGSGLVKEARSKPKIRVTKARLTLVAMVVVMSALSFFDTSRHWLMTEAQAISFEAGMLIAPYVVDGLEQRTGIAVLPFENLGDASDTYYSDGIAAEILNTLVKSNRLPVIARSSSVQLGGHRLSVEEIGEKLGVTYVLEGRLTRRDNEVIISAELIDALNGTQIWSGRFTRNEADVFEVQNEISELVLQKIGELVELSEGNARRAKGTKNPRANELYLEGTYLAAKGNPDDMLKAIEVLHEAVGLDDQFAEAWKKLCVLYVIGTISPYTLFPPSQVYPIAMHIARKVLTLDPDDAEVMAILGWLVAFNDYDWAEAKRLMQRALKLNRNNAWILHAYGQFLALTGQEEDGFKYIEQAYKLNPFDFLIAQAKAGLLFYKGEKLNAFGVISNMRFYGKDRYDASHSLSVVNLQLGRTKAAREHFEKAKALVQGQPVSLDQQEIRILLQEGNAELLELKRQALFERGRSSYVDNIVYLSSNDDERVESYKIMYQNRNIALVSLLFNRGKPHSMTDSDWGTLLENVNYQQLEIRDQVSAIRTASSIAALRELAIPLSTEELTIYVGTYKGTAGRAMALAVENGNLVRLRYSTFNRLDKRELIAIGKNQFEAISTVGLKYTFTEKDGMIVSMEYSNEQNPRFNSFSEKISDEIAPGKMAKFQ